MKKSIVCIGILLGCLNARASVVTNWVYVVSNIFNNVYSESIVTQKVKNSHTDYYFTNYVSVVTNVYQTMFRTNINMNVIFDNFGPYVSAASNAAANASSYASSAATWASSAERSASGASASAASASVSATAASTAASDGLAAINERISWFDEHAGETITMITTNVNVAVTTNLTRQTIEIDYTGAFSTPAEAVYTNHVSNTVWPKIKTHPFGADGGATIGAYSTETYAGVKIDAWPLQRVDNNAVWSFVPAYIDSDDKGMRLQYVPTAIVNMPYREGNKTYWDWTVVPEYLYWQDGYLYFKVNRWKNGQVGGWTKGKMVYNTYPRPINYGSTSGTGITLDSRSNYGGNSSAVYSGYFHHTTRSSARFAFPQTITPSLAPVLSWMQNGPR